MEINENAEHKEIETETQTQTETKYHGFRAMPYVVGNEAFAQLGIDGTISNLQVYLITVFNMKNNAATTLLNVFSGTANLGTIVGAFLADAYVGRYKTLAFACVASFLGMLVLALTAAIPKFHPPPCGSDEDGNCTRPNPGQMLFLLMGFGLLIIGAAGIYPCNLAFGADQFDQKTESGKKGIRSYFSWYYFTYEFAMMIALTGVVYIQSDVSWTWGLAIPAILMLLGCCLFFLGSRIYVKVQPNGSPLTGILRVLVAATRKRKAKLPSESSLGLGLFNHVSESSINSKLFHTNQLRCLDKAAIVMPEDRFNEDGSSASPWRLCTVQQVEEVKCMVRVLPIWISAIIYMIAIVQQQNYTVYQAIEMDRRLGPHFKIPPASYYVFSLLALTTWIPIYNQIIVPLLRKITRKEEGITVLQRMGTGFFLAVIANLVSGLVEEQRRRLALKNPTLTDPEEGSVSPLSGLWLVPQLVLLGISQAFALIAQVEFYYQQFPENMRSTGSSLIFVGSALSSYLSSLMVSIINQASKGHGTQWVPDDLNKGKLDYLYYLVAAMEAVNLAYFIVCARWYKYKGTNEDVAGEDDREDDAVKNLI